MWERREEKEWKRSNGREVMERIGKSQKQDKSTIVYCSKNGEEQNKSEE